MKYVLWAIHDLLMGVFRKRIQPNGFYLSYSQYGEDMLLRGFLSHEWDNPSYRGFWVDVGAHHPTIYSNTKIFYDRGWRGINIDAMSDAIQLFKQTRPEDINVNVGVGKTVGTLDYYMFLGSCCNTFSKKVADEILAHPEEGNRLLEVRKVPVVTLKSILDENLPVGQAIDFFSVDVEGLDLEVLESNDWGKYRPRYVLVEIHLENHVEDVLTCDVARFLFGKGYVFAGQCFCTTLFKSIEEDQLK